MAEHQVIEGWRGICVASGLATPSSRALCTVLAVGVLSYAMKMPSAAFRPDGSLRPYKRAGQRATDGTKLHYFLTPLVAGGAVFLFT